MTTDAYRDPPQTQEQLMFGAGPGHYYTTINGVHVFRSCCECKMCCRIRDEAPADYQSWAALVAMRCNKEKGRTQENFHYIRHALLKAAFEDLLEGS